MTWTAPEVSLPDGPPTGDDRPILEGYLAWHRALLRHKCAGLTGVQLAELLPSRRRNLSLLGLVRHMAKVERKWFRELIAEQRLEPMYYPALGNDADFEDLDPGRAQGDYERLVEECRLAEEALAAASYDDSDHRLRAGVMSVRAVVVHMIEEYAQHNGHAATCSASGSTARRTSEAPGVRQSRSTITARGRTRPCPALVAVDEGAGDPREARRAEHEVDAHAAVALETLPVVVPVGVDLRARACGPDHVGLAVVEERLERRALGRRHVGVVGEAAMSKTSSSCGAMFQSPTSAASSPSQPPAVSFSLASQSSL